MFNSGEIIALTAVVGGFLLLFVPIVALVTRKLVRDIATVLADRREPRGAEDTGHPIRADVQRLDQRLERLEREIRGLKEAVGFERQLERPREDLET